MSRLKSKEKAYRRLAKKIKRLVAAPAGQKGAARRSQWSTTTYPDQGMILLEGPRQPEEEILKAALKEKYEDCLLPESPDGESKQTFVRLTF